MVDDVCLVACFWQSYILDFDIELSLKRLRSMLLVGSTWTCVPRGSRLYWYTYNLAHPYKLNLLSQFPGHVYYVITPSVNVYTGWIFFTVVVSLVECSSSPHVVKLALRFSAFWPVESIVSWIGLIGDHSILNETNCCCVVCGDSFFRLKMTHLLKWDSGGRAALQFKKIAADLASDVDDNTCRELIHCWRLCACILISISDLRFYFWSQVQRGRKHSSEEIESCSLPWIVLLSLDGLHSSQVGVTPLPPSFLLLCIALLWWSSKCAPWLDQANVPTMSWMCLILSGDTKAEVFFWSVLDVGAVLDWCHLGRRVLRVGGCWVLKLVEGFWHVVWNVYVKGGGRFN